MQTDSIKVCLNCGKQLEPGKRGSLTQWIFRKDSCSCATPAILDSNFVESKSGLSTSDATIGPGSIIAEHYRIKTKIAEGGMGAIYESVNLDNENTVAIKVLRSELAEDQNAIARFEQEAAALSSLAHPNLVTVLEFGFTTAGSPYLVMEYLDGRSLEAIIKDRKLLQLDELIDILVQICEALTHAHSMHVVHRDLKPSNVIVCKTESGDNLVKVVDFGIAKILKPRNSVLSNGLTQTGELVGSPYFMSPEQCLGKSLDTRSDIYSLGCLIFYCLSGTVPFNGDNPVQVILAHLHSSSKNLSFHDFRIPNDLATIIERCLEKDADDRYPSTDLVKDDLLRFKEGKALSRQKPTKREKQKLKRRIALLALSSTAVISLLAIGQSIHIFNPLPTQEKQWHEFDIRGQQLFDKGRYKEAKDCFQESLRLAKAMSSREFEIASLNELLDLSRATLDSIAITKIVTNLDALLQPGNEVKRLEDRLDAALTMSEIESDKYKRERLISLCQSANDVANVLNETRNYETSVRVLSKTLLVIERRLGDKEPVLARCLHNLAVAAHHRLGAPEALVAYKKALMSERRLLPASDPTTAKTLIAIARTILQTKDAPESARPYLDEAMQINRKNFGPESLQVAWTRFYLAKLDGILGLKEEALEEINGAIAMFKNGNYDDTEKKAECYALLSSLSNDIGACKTALALQEERTRKEYASMSEILIELATLENLQSNESETNNSIKYYLARANAISQRFEGINRKQLSILILEQFAVYFKRTRQLDLYTQAHCEAQRMQRDEHICTSDLLAQIAQKI